MNELKASTVEVASDLSPFDVESGATLNTSVQAVRAPEAQRGRRSLVRAFSIATMLPFARMEEELLRAPRHDIGALAQSPYITFIEYGEADLVPVLGFTLGGPRIVLPKRVTLSPAALRALDVDRLIMGPIMVDLEE